MIERTIVLPHCTNTGKSNQEYIKRIQGELLALVGGFSSLEQTGVWLSEDGNIYEDKSLRIVTTCEPEKDTILTSRIPTWCAMLEQECLYTHTTQVDVSFIEPALTALLVG